MAIPEHSILHCPDTVSSFALNNFRSSGICPGFWGPRLGWLALNRPLWPKSGLKGQRQRWKQARAGRSDLKGNKCRQGVQRKESTAFSHDGMRARLNTSPHTTPCSSGALVSLTTSFCNLAFCKSLHTLQKSRPTP